MRNPATSLFAPAVAQDATSAAALAEQVSVDAAESLLTRQKPDGHLLFELEADATISAEYIFLNHFLDDLEPEREAELGAYLRSIQSDRHGGWPLFHDGDFNMSASVKAYYALKLIGDDPNAEHMARARAAILEHGGAKNANVFTRYTLALFGQVPWHAVPSMPVELMLMPRWFPVNIWKMSYWSRTVVVPLLVLAALKPRARNPRGIGCQELFCEPPEQVRGWNHNPTGSRWGEFFLGLDKLLHPADRHVFPRMPTRRRAIDRAVRFITLRLNGEDGIGAIFPAMAHTVMAFDRLGYGRDHPDYVTALASVRKLLVPAPAMRDGTPRYCQPCVSPLWDTALAGHALLEAGVTADDSRLVSMCNWLAERQITDVAGDWAINAPGLAPGGWAFQYRNDHYPDVDDTAVVGMLLHRVDPDRYGDQISRAATWIEGMQSSNGGWGAFDIDNNADFLNSIPFADHGALLDPPTADVSARCVSFLAQIGHGKDHPRIARGLAFLKSDQQPDGSWFGRWGTNYVYGTWSVLCALNAVGEDMNAPYVRRAVEWLLARQRDDGGWGEDGVTYYADRRGDSKASTASQTSWAVLGLIAAGEADNAAVASGVRFLIEAPRRGDKWDEPWHTAVGFPRVFYLRYHGYSAYFPAWALGRFARLQRTNSRSVNWGM